MESPATIGHYLSLVDIFIVFFSIIFCFFLAKAKTRDTNNNAFLLMNQSLGLPLFVATLTSSWYGGIFGVTQIAFEEGFYNFVTQGLSWYFAYLVFAIFFVKKIRAKKASSLAALIGSKFGSNYKKVAAFSLFLHALPITYAYALGVFFQSVFNTNFFLSVVIGSFIVAIYSSKGGLKGIVVTDAFQFFLMFLSVILVVVFSFFHYGALGFLHTNLPSHYFTFVGDSSLGKVFTWFLVASLTTLIHPVFYQRCIAAKSDNTAILGIFLATIFWLIFDICTTLGGMYAKAVSPLSPPQSAYLFYSLELLPAGLKGLFIAGVLASILSTLDSFLFVSGTSLSADFYGYKSPSSHRKYIYLSCGVSVLVAGAFGSQYESLLLLKEGFIGIFLISPLLVAILLKKVPPKKTIFIFGGFLAVSYFFMSVINPKLQHISLLLCLALAVVCPAILFLKTKMKTQTKVAKFSSR